MAAGPERLRRGRPAHLLKLPIGGQWKLFARCTAPTRMGALRLRIDRQAQRVGERRAADRLWAAPNASRGHREWLSMWRLGSVRQEMLSLIEERLRYVCSAAGIWQATR